jgi:hypothetical protein
MCGGIEQGREMEDGDLTKGNETRRPFELSSVQHSAREALVLPMNVRERRWATQ